MRNTRLLKLSIMAAAVAALLNANNAPTQEGGGTAPIGSKTPVARTACRWELIAIAITAFGKKPPPEKGKPSTWQDRLKEEAKEAAQRFVASAASKTQKGIIEAVQRNITIKDAAEVYLTYACIEGGNTVVCTEVIPLDLAESMDWWAKQSGDKNVSKKDQTATINRHRIKLGACPAGR